MLTVHSTTGIKTRELRVTRQALQRATNVIEAAKRGNMYLFGLTNAWTVGSYIGDKIAQTVIYNTQSPEVYREMYPSN